MVEPKNPDVAIYRQY